MAGTSAVRFYFRLFAGSIKAQQVMESFKVLRATIGRRPLIIWDRLQAHRSRLVRQYVQSECGAIALEYLPPYASELNLGEYIWAYLKSHAMPTYCAKDMFALRTHASSRLRPMQRRRTLVAAFWQQPELS